MEITKKRIAGTVLILMVLFVYLFFQPQGQISSASVESREMSDFNLVNAERENKLTWDDCLAEQARVRAEFLVVNNYWGHYTPDGKTPWEFIEKCGYDYAGENLAKDFNDNAKMHTALMNSEKHKKNIMNPRFEKVGVGCYRNICVEFFKK